MGDFRKLHVWESAHDLTLKIYKLSAKLPKEELFGITSQIRRSAVSVEANIAESEGRFHFQEKIQFFYTSRASITEIKAHLIIISDLYKKFANDALNLFEEYSILEKQVNSLISYRKKNKK